MAMSLATPIAIRTLQRKLYRGAKEKKTRRNESARGLSFFSVCRTMKPVGEPDAGDRHVRFDERGWETERCQMAQATAPLLDSTIGDLPPCSTCVRDAPLTGHLNEALKPTRMTLAV